MILKSDTPLALVLLSGGLDSLLAARLLMDQNVRVSGAGFRTPFFGSDKGAMVAEKLGIPFYSLDISEEHFELVKNPPHGYGGAINPCIDCHSLMIKSAWDFLSREGETENGFVATGEVMGQRPMSQNKQALSVVERCAGLPQGRLLRPLSAKILPETEMERRGFLDREKLLDISGRGRTRQLELARKYGIDYFAPPAGGCVLTEKEFSKSLRELIRRWPDTDAETAGLIRYGRVCFFDSAVLVLARNKEENTVLEKSARKGDILVSLKRIPGPTGIIRPFGYAKVTEDMLSLLREKIRRYSRRAQEVPMAGLDFVVRVISL